MFTTPLEGYEDQAGGLWRHDLFCAIASRAVSRFARDEFGADLAFTAGLLHDLGKAILSDFLRGTSSGVLAEIASGNTADYLAAEKALLGLDHARVGFELAQSWQLPEVLQQIILHHHHPLEAEEQVRPLAYAVHLGDILAMMGGHGTGSDAMRYHLDQGYTEYFNITNEDLARLLLEVTEEFQKLEASLNVIKEPLQ